MNDILLNTLQQIWVANLNKMEKIISLKLYFKRIRGLIMLKKNYKKRS